MLDPTFPATKFYRDSKGQPQVLDVHLQYSRPLPAKEAVDQWYHGATVFVCRQDAQVVAEAIGIKYGG